MSLATKIKIDPSGLGQSHWYEYLIRFLFGGIVTALAGVIAKRYGPSIGGLFLAFPAILPATATLLARNQQEKKQGQDRNSAQKGGGVLRGREAAGVDAAGASMGTIGLAVFALIVWKGLPHLSLAVVLPLATLAYFVTALSIWSLRETLWRRLREQFRMLSRHSDANPHRS
jgi:drug/metabolite transporter (DMT)-like permease